VDTPSPPWGREQGDPYSTLLKRAPHGGEHHGVRMLRDFTYAEMMAGRISGATQDEVGRLLDALAASLEACVGDIIGPRGPIPWDVLAVQSLVDDGRYTRLIGRDRLVDLGDEHAEVAEYDWSTAGGYATDEGVLHYAPIRVLEVAHRPDCVPAPDLVEAIRYALQVRQRDWELTVGQLVERIPVTGTTASHEQVLTALRWMRREGQVFQPSPHRWALRREEEQR